MGVAEFIRFDCEDDVRPLRVWDRIDDDLVERALPVATEAPSTQLQVDWVVTLEPQLGPALRPRDRQTGRLLPTPAPSVASKNPHLWPESSTRNSGARLAEACGCWAVTHGSAG